MPETAQVTSVSPQHTRRRGWLVGALVLLASCAQPGIVRNYNADVQQNFLDSCAAADPTGRGSACQCIWAQVSTRLSFDELKSAERAMTLAVDAGDLTDGAQFRAQFPQLAAAVDSCDSAGPQLG